MKFRTVNRQYEADTSRKLIRQIGGPTREGDQRLTTEWREYAQLTVAHGRSATIIWPDSTPRLSAFYGVPTVPATITSKVLEILDDEERDTQS